MATINKVLRKDSATYAKYLANFRKQFPNISHLTKVYVNHQNQVFAGEWVDTKGVYNLNSGYAPDVKFTIYIKEPKKA